MGEKVLTNFCGMFVIGVATAPAPQYIGHFSYLAPAQLSGAGHCRDHSVIGDQGD